MKFIYKITPSLPSSFLNSIEPIMAASGFLSPPAFQYLHHKQVEAILIVYEQDKGFRNQTKPERLLTQKFSQRV